MIRIRKRTRLSTVVLLATTMAGAAACSGSPDTDRVAGTVATAGPSSARLTSDGPKPVAADRPSGSVAPVVPPAAAGDTPESGAYGTELLTHLRTTPHGSHVSKVRVASSYKVYKVTLETDLVRGNGSDTQAEEIVRDRAGKLLTETAQWAEDHPALWVGGIEILDSDRDAIDFRLGAERDDRKPAADDYGSAMLAALHTTPEGTRLQQVRLTLDHKGKYEVAIDTDLSSHLPGDYSTEAAQTFNTAARILLVAQNWIRDHPGFDVAALRVYDVERGLITIKVVD
ncbi:hypothetical protein OG948_15675 [Embleya sp. NBC_00888]|uniref:hypothetical protein n=1 Tax=Embleya sp. NBC_00888 TaxID=2975960 RepID=UPI00386F6D4D|nr:hypothetical protein OG948_15675 [Embleya sp. NBC_00888]